MLTTKKEGVARLSANARKEWEDGSSSPLFFDNFIKRTLKGAYEELGLTYPMEIKIPKSIREMLEGDFEPSRIIRLEKPVMWGDTPVWFGNSTKGVFIILGNKNGDSRYPGDDMLDDGNSGIHMLLVGKTGMGKSVTLNALIFQMLLEYAPWEINLTMSDAKIVEFKRYAFSTEISENEDEEVVKLLKSRIPHISAISATSDTDYLISLLEDKYQEMLDMNSVFASKGVQNIKDFRKKTGLCIPQNVIIIDEFQAMFKNAGKKAGRVSFLIDEFARLGRNTGYHLILASQGLSPDMSKDTLRQISIRAALGCSPEVSDIVLGNNAAGSITQKGRLILNKKPDVGKKDDNIFYRVPFQPDNQYLEQKMLLDELGKKYGFVRDLTFYDEKKFKRESAYLDYLRGFTSDRDTILLGEPSYIIEDSEKIIKIKMDAKDFENICILNIKSDNIKRYVLMLKYNMMLKGSSVRNVIYYADEDIYNETNLNDIALKVGNMTMAYKIKNAEDGNLNIAFDTLYKRLIMVEADDYIFTKGIGIGKDTLAVFREYFPQGDRFDTELMLNRFQYIIGVLEDKVHLPMFGRTGEEVYKLASLIIRQYANDGFETVRVDKRKFIPIYVWIIGYERILGYGRNPSSRCLNRLKTALQDCCEFGVRFIVVTKTFEEGSDICSSLRYYLLENPSPKELTRIKCESYPPQKPAVLGVLYDATDRDNCYKFKKLIFDKEIVKD